MRTLDLFVSALVAKTGGAAAGKFRGHGAQGADRRARDGGGADVRVAGAKIGLPDGRAAAGTDGRDAAGDHRRRRVVARCWGFIAAADGRCSSLHFGVYDYTASFGITAAYQAMGHPACDFARTVMVAALAGTGVQISDGATNILPVGPHRGADFPTAQLRENREAVHGAWRLAFEDTLHSLRNGIYEGWDLHPAQLIARYAAVYSFFLAGLPAASGRLKAFVEKAALASLFGDVFDDAATGQGLSELLPARHRVWSDHRGRGTGDRADAGRNSFALVPENPARSPRVGVRNCLAQSPQSRKGKKASHRGHRVHRGKKGFQKANFIHLLSVLCDLCELCVRLLLFFLCGFADFARGTLCGIL